MIQTDTVVEERPAAIPVAVWAWLLVAVILIAVLAMLQGQFAVVHELVHDSRHFIGVPCH